MRRLAALAFALLLVAACRWQSTEDALGNDPRHGATVIARSGCGVCHVIPGVTGARGRVGPPLDHVGGQAILAGTLPNTPANMALWIRSPQSVRPGDAMPNLELSEHDARDVAAYLDTLR